MKIGMRRVCLITPGHVASTPRLVKEADALVAAGYAVHVVAGRHYAPVDPLDEAVLAGSHWTCDRVMHHRGVGSLMRRLVRLGARRVASSGLSTGLVARAHHAAVRLFAARAARWPAELYLGHCLAALPAAAWAARQRGGRYGFDLEDFHEAETVQTEADPVERSAARLLQSRFLPNCAHLTAASPLIAEKIHELYGVWPITVLNVFPLADAPAKPAVLPQISAGRPARLHWVSQVIGPGRGLEEILTITARMSTPAQLHLRGLVGAGYRESLLSEARRLGLPHPPVFLPSAPSAELARLAADNDLGLSIEPSTPFNRQLSLSNKIFTYLLAGIPQLMTPTSAQRALAVELGAAAILSDLSKPAQTAATLDAWFVDPAGAVSARRHATELARTRYCWDLEQSAFLDSVGRAFA
jgi:hypothetical protein